MIVTKTVDELKKSLEQLVKSKETIAFVPTMGALHEGHISLVKKGEKVATHVVVSIFVNPTQFDNSEDLEKYPRVLDKDISLLEKNGTQILFAPSASEVYPKGLDTSVDLNLEHLDKTMEGEHRTGHFEGVVQVVKRLLDIVNPNYLVMGQKDFQQFSIIRYMIEKLALDVELIVGKTKREADGLAMSSRNRRLTDHYRKISPEIYKVLKYVKRNLRKKSIPELQNYALNRLRKSGLRPEYFTIFDGYTLLEIQNMNNHRFIVAATAAWAGDIRLIDNLPLRKPRSIKFL